MVTLSPDFKNFGGEKPMPTPTGVPVAIISPASNVPVRVSVSINVGISKISPGLLHAAGPHHLQASGSA